MSTNLLSEIEAFLAETGLGDYRFGILAVNNGRLVERLRAGITPKGKPARIWPDTEIAVRAFMRAERKRIKNGRKVAA